MRTVLIGLIIVLLMVTCVWAIRSNQNAMSASGQLQEERYKRMLVEEGLQETNNKLTEANNELARAQDRIAKMEVTLEKSNLIIEDFRKRLDQAAIIKTNLDKQIAELQAMVAPM